MSPRARTRATNAALRAYGVAAGQPDEPLETQLTDLLADLLHRYAASPRALAERPADAPADPTEWLASVVRRANGHYAYERTHRS